jgi:hypothetical protein
VSLRKNYGSGFTFPLFLIWRRKIAKLKKSSTAIPRAEQLQENKIAVNQMLLIFVKVQDFDKDFKIKDRTYFH